jgi:23S rRNA (guanosine2251-2'-O)-methyltransferase
VIEGPSGPLPVDRLYLYGLHTVEAALNNPARGRHRLYATANARARLDERGLAISVPVEIVDPRWIDARVGADAVHQGVLLEVDALEPVSFPALKNTRLILALDQITDPHNAGAILRSAVALGADAVLTTTRNAARESGVLAKAASGALDMITYSEVTNLAKALEDLRALGFVTVALDSAGSAPLEAMPLGDRVVLVLGSEGKGVRPGVRAVCDHVARLDMPGKITSLNVSNAAVLALYIARKALSC